MRVAVVLVALFVSVGCGASVEPATNNGPIACEPPTGRFTLAWELTSGNCGPMPSTVADAPTFGCTASTEASSAEGVCASSIVVTCDGSGSAATTCVANCAPSTATLRCTTTDNAAFRCVASVAMPSCSGQYTLTMTRAD